MTDESKNQAQPGLEALVADVVKLGRIAAALGRSIHLPSPDTNAMQEFVQLEQSVLTRICDLYSAKSGHIADGAEMVDMYKRQAAQANQLSNSMLALGKIAEGSMPQPREYAGLAIKHITRDTAAPAQPVAAQQTSELLQLIENVIAHGEEIGEESWYNAAELSAISDGAISMPDAELIAALTPVVIYGLVNTVRALEQQDAVLSMEPVPHYIDSAALGAATEIMRIVNGSWLPGGATQIQAKIQCMVIELLRKFAAQTEGKS